MLWLLRLIAKGLALLAAAAFVRGCGEPVFSTDAAWHPPACYAQGASA